MKIRFLLALLFATTYAFAQETAKHIHVSKPGTLPSELTLEEAQKITKLTLTGTINAIDFKHLRDDFSELEELDLKNVSIKFYAGKQGPYTDRFYVYPNNCIPAYAFSFPDSTFNREVKLKEVILSNKIKNIEDCAFKDLSSLAVVRLTKRTPPNLLKEAISPKNTAVFVPLGTSDTYRSKKNWSRFALLEGDPVTVHVQVGQMSSLERELQQLNVHPKEIHFLTIAGKLEAEDFELIRDYMPNLVNVDLTETTALEIPEYTFTQKKYLLKIALPKGLVSIKQRAFSGCIRLSGTLVLPSTLSGIEFGAFMGCESLEELLVTGQPLLTLGEQALEGTSIKIRNK